MKLDEKDQQSHHSPNVYLNILHEEIRHQPYPRIAVLRSQIELIQVLELDINNQSALDNKTALLALIERSVELEEKDKKKWKKLHTVMPLILKAALLPDQLWESIDASANNLLHVAAETGNPDVISHLLKFLRKSEDGHRRNADGQTPLHLAVIKGHQEAAKRLASSIVLASIIKKANVSLDARDNKSLTPMFYAVSGQCDGIVKLLNSYKALSLLQLLREEYDKTEPNFEVAKKILTAPNFDKYNDINDHANPRHITLLNDAVAKGDARFVYLLLLSNERLNFR